MFVGTAASPGCEFPKFMISVSYRQGLLAKIYCLVMGSPYYRRLNHNAEVVNPRMLRLKNILPGCGARRQTPIASLRAP